MGATFSTLHKKDFKDHPLLARLLELHKVPEQLHIQGTLPDVTLDEYGRGTPRILTIVGSRKNTTYGKHVLTTLISSLKGYDIVILSGLALGIDGLAHEEALKNDIRTIAIPGSGLSPNVIYPSSHKHLAQDIVGYGGALISEIDNNTRAAPWTFPQRNRIMAALSDALLVIEAEEKSGTLITARLALELGKDIGAIPGEIFSPTSSGTNMLIHEGAYPITSATDLLNLLHLSKKSEHKETNSLSPEEERLLHLLREPCDKDSLFAQSNMTFETFLSTYSSLEIQGLIEETFGEVRRLV